MEFCETFRKIPNPDRSPLYDVINPACRSSRDTPCEVMFSRTMFSSNDLQAMICKRCTIGEATGAMPGAFHRSSIPSGGARRDRTDDLMLAKHALSQLSYGPVPEDECLCSWRPSSLFELRRGSLRLHLARLAVAGEASEGWWAWEDLNFRPHAYQARALTN